MKICFWMTSLFSLGGTKRVVTLLANELAKNHDVTIMCHENRMREKRYMYDLSDDVKVDFLNIYEYIDDNRRNLETLYRKSTLFINNKTGLFNNKIGAGILGDASFPVRTRKKLAAYINDQHYDVVIATARMALWLSMMAPDLNCKTVGWQHNCYDGYIHVKDTLFWKQERLLQKYLPQLDAYVVLSKYDQRDFKEKLNIDTVVKTNPRSFVSAQKCNCESKRFLMVTRFVYAKGLDLMLDAFQEFMKSDDEWELDILGSGDLQKEIEREAKRRKIQNRFHIVGYTEKVQQYYLNSSVLLLPSRWEGWPMVIMEAYEYGLPVIAFHTGSMDLIIKDGVTGFLPKAFDTKAFADAMLKLAHDDELRKEMSQNAIRESDLYDIEKIGKDWEEFLKSL